MSIQTLLHKKDNTVLYISPDATLSACAAMLCEKRVGALVVMETGGEVAGIVSERDLVRSLNCHSGDCLNLKVKDIMTPREKLITATPADDLDDVMKQISDHHVRHIPVFEGGSLVALVSIGDVVKALLDMVQGENQYMREYITGAR